MCGTGVAADASECPGCGESFSPLENGEPELEPEFVEDEYIEDTLTTPDEELGVPEYADSDESVEYSDEPIAESDDYTLEEVSEDDDYCPDCGSQYDEDGSCPGCLPLELDDEAKDGCPICGSGSFTVESGDLVSCGDCGNVYIRKEYGGAEQSWKWKFWVGLVFIIVGDIGVALGSYVHNVFQWSPLGPNPYLGYGWLDQLVGIVGIVLFLVGLLLFAWSFKREREVQCPSCKVIVLEGQLTEAEDEDEEIVPEELAVESALEEIDEIVECPSCSAEVSMFDTSCENCGALFEMEDEFELEEGGPLETDDLAEELEGPIEIKHGSELDEDEMVMESLELEGPEVSEELNGDSQNAMDELESALDIPLDDEMEVAACPSCGAMVGKGLDTCPGCGEPINSEGGE